ncbi:MAG TPA: MarR family transcriptional regulator [Planctomycetota bacterium]|nr:MarR family transcriptional regulator [Planctomycetota bacterium]
MRHDWSRFYSEGHRLLVLAIRVAEQLGKAGDRFLKPYRITLVQLNILTVLSTVPDGLPQSKLSERLVVSRANVTGLVRRLKALGLCKTVGNPNDARIKTVRLTPAGRKLLDRLETGYFTEIERITACFKEAEKKSASDLLDRLEKVVQTPDA